MTAAKKLKLRWEEGLGMFEGNFWLVSNSKRSIVCHVISGKLDVGEVRMIAGLRIPPLPKTAKRGK